MNSISSTNRDSFVEDKSQFLKGFKKFFIFPLKAGLQGFVLVLSVILIVKLLSFLLGINELFSLDLMDIMLSSMGFVFMSLIHILKNIN
ncbi:MAG: hypothetical protein HXY50_13325 [Ignavibacteriaceae bacterium]|nr:hypothetical protein [Ignavibacteriaceae bacterium]